MRDPLVHGELEHLRVDHDQPHIARVGAIEQRQNHGVDRNRFAGTGCTGNQQVGHLGQVGDDGVAEDVLAQSQRQAPAGFLELVSGKDLLEVDHLAVAVGDLDADHAAARNRSDDAD